MNANLTVVGLDSHKDSISVAMLAPGAVEPVQWKSATTLDAVRRMVNRIRKVAPGDIVFCYEAGPCGFTLQRQIVACGSSCVVVAPSLIPTKPGDRVKTDRRDARKLAELHRAGLLTEVHPPSEADEAARNLSRCREDAQEDLLRCRHHIGHMLLRLGKRYEGGRTSWTQKYNQWLRTLRFGQDADQTVFDQYLLAMEQTEERLKTLVGKVEALAQTEPYRQPVAALRCFRGIDTITAMTIVTELHGFQRFDSPRGLMAYLGLVPSEDSTGNRQRRFRITKTGNSHVRRILVEAAWHYRGAPTISAPLRKRRDGQPIQVIAIADKAMQRLNRRFWRLVHHGKPPTKAVVAVARELAGFVWAALQPAAK